MNDIVIRIKEDGTVSVEENENGVKSYKRISPDSLLECINKSILRGTVFSGLLPRGCLSYTAHDNGYKDVYILHPENKADISYHGTMYKDFPLPKLAFGFRITGDGRISSCGLGVVGNDDIPKLNTPMYHYPFSNVSGFSLCTGNNTFPKVTSLHTLGSIPYYILSMDNNNDHFKPHHNKLGLEMRDLLELIKDKQPSFYYSDILIKYPNATLNDFISGRKV